MQTKSKKKVVVIGGGTGSFTILSGLKHVTSEITALVSMADDGGSSGVLRDELGVLPPGDIRQCLVALSDDATSQTLRELFNFRFQSGSLDGHSFGNLFLSAVEKMTNDFEQAVRLAGELLHITGQVLPITRDNTRLAVSWGDDDVVRGESVIDKLDFAVHGNRRPDLFLEPKAQVNPRAVKAIHEADFVVIAPGDIYTSLGPLLVVDGVADALEATHAQVIYVANLTVNPRQTKGLSLAGHVAELERFGGSPFIDIVLYNTSEFKGAVLKRYIEAGETPVVMKPEEHAAPQHYKVIGADLLSRLPTSPKSGDKLALHRSFLRHDPLAVADEITKLIS